MSDTDATTGLSPDEKITREARRRFHVCEEWESTARTRFVEDEKFCYGDADNRYQWNSTLYQTRESGGKPCLTINKTKQHCLQIINDARQNKAGIEVRPVGEGASVEAAEIFEGVVRHIEYISNAQAAYDTATWNQVVGGIGWWRVITDYASDDSFNQEIFIRRVPDALSIYLDPDIQQYDGSDAKYGFVFRNMPKDEFDAAYPKLKGQVGTSVLDEDVYGASWWDEEHVRVVEYYRKVEDKQHLIALVDGSTMREEDAAVGDLQKMVAMAQGFDPASMDPAALAALDPMDAVRRGPDGEPLRREISVSRVEWFLIAGDKIADRSTVPGTYIPLVRVVGEETVIDGQMDRRGHTRALKDPQRMYNYYSPLSLDTRLPTPNGWTTMGATQPGDWLLDEKGRPVEVVGISPTYINRECFRVEFDDGSHIIADGEHNWTIERRGKRKGATFDWSVRTIPTRDIKPGSDFIYVADPLELPEAALPVDPYFLGVWLGDGSSAEPNITAGVGDAGEMRSLLLERGLDVGQPRVCNGGTVHNFTVHGVRKHLSALGLLGNKHIPAPYLRASRDQRIALLQGLMDTDGSFNPTSRQSVFVNVAPALIEGFAELVRSLGLKAVRCAIPGARRMFPSGRAYDCQDSVKFSFSAPPDFPVFRLSRKAKAQCAPRKIHPRRTRRHTVVSVTPVASVPVKCVAVKSASHLFLAGEGMVPTHNSRATELMALQTNVPWMVSLEAVEGAEEYYKNANTENFAYLPWRERDENGNPNTKPERIMPPQMGDSVLKGMQFSASEMMMVSGQYQAVMGAPSNETSGKAINARQRQGDNATYHFIDHLAQAMRFTGKILLQWIPLIYDTERVMRVIAENGDESEVHIDPQAKMAHQAIEVGQPTPGTPGAPQMPSGTSPDSKPDVRIIFNPRVGKYDVIADVGPAYATQRQEAFNAFVQIMQANPDLMGAIGDLMFKAADFPMAQDIAERLNEIRTGKTVPKELVDKLQAALAETQKRSNETIGTLAQQLASAQLARQKVQVDAARTAGENRDGGRDSVADLMRVGVDATKAHQQHSIAEYDAETRRMAAMGNIDAEALKPLVRELVSQLLQEPVVPLMAAHAKADQARMPKERPGDE